MSINKRFSWCTNRAKLNAGRLESIRIYIYSRKFVWTGKGESMENRVAMCRQYIVSRLPNGRNTHVTVNEDVGILDKNLDRPQFSNAFFKIQIPGKSAVSMIPIGNAAPTTARVSAPNAIAPAMLNLSWWQIAAVVWLAGTMIFLAYYFVKHCRFLKLAVRWSKNITEKQTLTLLQTLKAQMGISQNISLRVCDSIGSPMMIGFVNLHILLPTEKMLPAGFRLHDTGTRTQCWIAPWSIQHCVLVM